MGLSSGFLAVVLTRLAHAIPIFFAIISINFLLIHVAPGDPASYLASQSEGSVEYQAQLRQEFGLDKPLVVQLGIYLGKVVRGDLGMSYRYRQPVADLILSRVGNTFLLLGTGYLLATLIGILLGAFAAQRANSFADQLTTFAALAFYSMPVFWLGQLMLLFFALELGWFPTQGMVNIRLAATGWAKVIDVAHHLVLPASTYALYQLTLMYRLARSKLQDVLKEDYITTARAKGLPERVVVYKHALRNALLPLVTVLGMDFAFVLAGTVLVETVFAWPGMGRLMFDAIAARDYPVLTGIFTVVTAMVIIVNILTDLIYAWIDPRVVYD
ncbi:MAG TPA: ABC transporter permease [Pseudolabrys sp.]|nr:ABC transporter permease [Pseudolabrys sp.]